MLLLVANGEFALRLFVLEGEVLQALDCGILGYCDSKFDVSFGILVPGLSNM
jgi:hypothetical protein